MSNALERWRERCERAIATGEGLPKTWGDTHKHGLRVALHELEVHDDPIEFQGFLAAEYLCLKPRDPARKSIARAQKWLREELAREGK